MQSELNLIKLHEINTCTQTLQQAKLENDRFGQLKQAEIGGKRGRPNNLLFQVETFQL